MDERQRSMHARVLMDLIVRQVVLLPRRGREVGGEIARQRAVSREHGTGAAAQICFTSPRGPRRVAEVHLHRRFVESP